jgi:hypothetical protein
MPFVKIWLFNRRGRRVERKERREMEHARLTGRAGITRQRDGSGGLKTDENKLK